MDKAGSSMKVKMSQNLERDRLYPVQHEEKNENADEKKNRKEHVCAEK